MNDVTTICLVQFIIDNPTMPPKQLEPMTKASHQTIYALQKELGIKPIRDYSKNKLPRRVRKEYITPELLAIRARWKPEILASLLEQYGYGSMKMSKVLKLCGVEARV